MEESESRQHLPWYVDPYEGESISHYFGRYRRHEAVSIPSAGQLSTAAGIGPVLTRWEKFRFIPFPSQQELEAIGRLVGLSVGQLEAMLPPKGEPIKLKPIRLCGACYKEVPYHRLEWQFQSKMRCERHQLRLLSRCPACREYFPIPAQWVEGKCMRCGMFFKSMERRQKSY